MVVLTFKTLDDCEREVEFDGREEAIDRMHHIPITCSNTRMCMTKAVIWLQSGDDATCGSLCQ